MSEERPDVLSEREQAILAGGLPPHLLRYDTKHPPDCDHCSRAARYSLVLGEDPDRRGRCVKYVCDACLERHYGSLDLPVVGRLYNDTQDNA